MSRLYVSSLGALTLLCLGCRPESVVSQPASSPAQPASKEPAATRLFVEPYLQKPTPTSMTLVWWTETETADNVAAYGKFERDQEQPASSRFSEAFGKWRHEATLEGLEPNTLYAYRVRSDTMRSGSYHFETLDPDPSALSFAFIADGRTDNLAVILRHRELLGMAGAADGIFQAGDFVYDGSTLHWFRYLRQIYTASDPYNPGVITGSVTPTFHIMGNHEITSITPGQEPTMTNYYCPPLGDVLFDDAFVSPANEDPRWEGRYYAVDYGAAVFIMLDTNNTSANEFDNHDYLADGSTPDWEPGSPQYVWLEAQLERAQSKPFTIVSFHPSAYSSGTHGTDCRLDPPPNKCGESDRKPHCTAYNAQRGYELRALHKDLFVPYGVDAVVSSHDHTSERSVADGIQYFVVGNSGYNARPAAPDAARWMSIAGNNEPPSYSQWFYDWDGNDYRTSFLSLSMERSDTTWKAIFAFVSNTTQQFDAMELCRSSDGQPCP